MSAHWIHCDIDGRGKRWRLAVERGDGLHFPEADFTEEMTIAEYRGEFSGHAVVDIAPPSFDPTIREVVHKPQGGGAGGTMSLCIHCSACYGEAHMTVPIGYDSSAWHVLRDGIRTAGWVVLGGDDRPAVTRPRHAKSTRQFCPSCAAELAAVMNARRED